MKWLVAAAVALAYAGALAEDAWQEPDWRSADAGSREAMVQDFHLVERDPPVKCGEHDFSVFRSAGMPEFSYCARSLKYRMRGRIPDFLVSGVRVGSEIGGTSGSVFEDVLVRYEKGAWAETVLMVIDYQDGKPRVLKQN